EGMTRNLPRRPVVGIPCDVKLLGVHPFHAVGEKYIAAVEGGAGTKPILLPVPRLSEGHFDLDAELDEIFALCDGIFLTGSHSNVHPRNYGGTDPREGVLLDEQRDALTLGLIRASVARGVPLFCVCRGFQEMNVAYGGTLHQHIHEEPGEPGFAPRRDHRENKDDPLDTQYGPAHEVNLIEGGAFETILGTRAIRVNSLHGQGVARLADRLVAEGRAPDGTVEAMSVRDAPGFALGVQWHPEWKYRENPVSLKLLGAFGDAVRKVAQQKARHALDTQRT
ncbi:gamma-glutamyl-gamma-aminobutyrate hydrolase family protein, partial [Parvibaculum sp.]|uniref:gamma-glutamyl-gamma-aminobutyrate hydrolase family protein n=1 Tax=Parvibaculum sp. TaxID=2024848 RepID=UPI002CF565C8